jgi:alpha-beta hydrolase superfamily lysophospholipase
MTLPDGLLLAYQAIGADQAIGAEGSAAALVLHGTPGSSRQPAGLDRPARDPGLALIVPPCSPSPTPACCVRTTTCGPGSSTTSDTPAHIWHGTEDRSVPVAHARMIAAACPAARLHIVEGGGHLLLSQLDQVIEDLAPHQG